MSPCIFADGNMPNGRVALAVAQNLDPVISRCINISESNNEGKAQNSGVPDLTTWAGPMYLQ